MMKVAASAATKTWTRTTAHNAASGVEVMSAASTDGTDSDGDCVRDL